jgi:hydroxylysine kinase
MLKISHPGETPLVADFQTQALLHIAAADPGLPVQRIVPTRDGLASFLWTAADGLCSAWCGCSATCPVSRCPTCRARRCSGCAWRSMLARLDRALAGFDHPAGALALPWDIQRADSVRGLLATSPSQAGARSRRACCAASNCTPSRCCRHCAASHP